MLKKIHTNQHVYHANDLDVITHEKLKANYQNLLNDIGNQMSYRKLNSYAKVTDFSFSLFLRGRMEKETMAYLHETKTWPGLAYQKTDTSSNINDYSVDELLAMARGNKNSWTVMLLGSLRNHSCKKQVTCLSCHGNTKCNNCEGDGTVICDWCYGRGKCSRCKGEGEIDCHNCKGSGSVSCSNCEGSGQVDCWNCDGDGWVECNNCDGDGWVDCWDCDGTGTYVLRNGNEVMCRKCHGTGRFDCTVCDGSGRFECSACEGSGTFVCRKCEGSGTQKCGKCRGKGIERCSDCKGSGTCSMCHGGGYVDCSLCKGDGVCKECDGIGEVECPKCEGTGYFQTFDRYQLKPMHVSDSKVFCSNDIIDQFDENEIGVRSIWKGEMIWDNKSGLQHEIILDELGSVLASSMYLGPIKKWIRPECSIPSEDSRFLRKNLTVLIYGVPFTEVHYKVGKKIFRFYILGNNNVIVIDDEQMPNKLLGFIRSFF